MTTIEILACLGVPLLFYDDLPDLGKRLGETDASFAHLTKLGKRVVVVADNYPESWQAYDVDGVLHEATHAVAGKASLKDEGAANVLQWLLIQELEDDERRMAREEFSGYMLHSGDIGMDDEFTAGEEWASMCEEALKLGLVVRRGGCLVPVWGSGVHPSFLR